MENQSGAKTQQNDELDLGQFFKLIGKGFQNLFKTFLRLIVYLKRNAVKLGILVIIGVGAGYAIKYTSTKDLKTEVIVKPNLGSESYLYDVVSELKANIKGKDSTFFSKLEIDAKDLSGFGMEIEPIEQESMEDVNSEIKYLELLEKFRDEVGMLDVIRTEILKNSTLNHRITYFYKEGTAGNEIAGKLMDYINGNAFYNELVAIYRKNAENRIVKNDELVVQIDGIIEGYLAQMSSEIPVGGSLVLNEQEQLNVPALLRLKNELIEITEKKRLEIQENVDPIGIISFGNSQEVIKPFFGRPVVLIPSILIILFLLVDIAKYLNRKAKEMELE